jgi:OmpA-OmpF porin, OOP family
MRCNPLRWVWGLLPIALLTFFVGQFEHAAIEDDLTKRVDAQLVGTGLRWAKTGFSARDGVLIGKATDESDPLKALELAQNTWGVRTVENRAELIEKADAYTWWATRTGNRLNLRGLVPNENTRQSILGLAQTQFPGLTVADEMRLARGVPSPDTWLSGVSFGLKHLGGLKVGEARLDGLGLSLSGEAATQATYRVIKTALAGDLPRGLRLTDDRVTPPVVTPYTWTARVAGQQVVLSGYVPNDRVRSEVIAASRAAFPKAGAPDDRMVLGDGAPSGFLGVITTSLKELARLEDGSADLRDAQLTVAGMAADEASAQTSRRNLRAAVPQSFRVVDQIKFRDTAPAPATPVSPYVGAVDVDGGRVVLSGYVPNGDVRDGILRSARTRFPGKVIDDRMTVAAGAPDGWGRCFDGGMLGLARLGNGRIALTDRRLDLTAKTDDDDLAAAVPSDVRSAVQGACDFNARIETVMTPEPDLSWRAIYTGSEITLRGDVTSDTVRSQLLEQARRQFAGARVTDDMRIVESRSKNWPRAAEIGLAQLPGLKSGEATLQRQQLTVSGEAVDQAVITAVRDRLGRDMVKGYAAREQITLWRQAAQTVTPPVAPPSVPPVTAPTVAPPPKAAVVVPPSSATEAAQCQERLREAAQSGAINFDRARATLTSDSVVTLNRLSEIARTCPRFRIEIEGHTDAEGTPERNQRLSDRRARAVLDVLIRSGVDAARVTAIGYGETRPVAPNDSPENRARNRRIEFTVNE